MKSLCQCTLGTSGRVWIHLYPHQLGKCTNQRGMLNKLSTDDKQRCVQWDWTTDNSSQRRGKTLGRTITSLQPLVGLCQQKQVFSTPSYKIKQLRLLQLEVQSRLRLSWTLWPSELCSRKLNTEITHRWCTQSLRGMKDPLEIDLLSVELNSTHQSVTLTSTALAYR